MSRQFVVRTLRPIEEDTCLYAGMVAVDVSLTCPSRKVPLAKSFGGCKKHSF